MKNQLSTRILSSFLVAVNQFTTAILGWCGRSTDTPYIIRALSGEERYKAELHYECEIDSILYGIVEVATQEILAVCDDLNELVNMVEERGFNIKRVKQI